MSEANATTWKAVDSYFTDVLVAEDEALVGALDASAAAGLPAIAVSAPQGKMLNLLARIHGAKSVLEVGTLGGYSTIWLSRALPADGRLVTLEIDPAHAEVARQNLTRAGELSKCEIVVGPALQSLAKLTGPFDLFFLDADKEQNPDYFAWALRLSRPGSVIIVDNVVRGGAVLDESGTNASIRGVRRLMDLIHAEPRVTATAIQTVGAKGYDGFVLAIVS